MEILTERKHLELTFNWKKKETKTVESGRNPTVESELFNLH